MFKKLLSLVLFFVICNAAWASNNASDFLRKGVSARAIGMGSAYTAVADYTEGVFFNPAGLILSVENECYTSSAVNNFDEVNRGNFGYAVRLSQYGLDRNTVLALNLSNSIVNDIPKTEWKEERPNTLGSFSSIKNNQTFSYSSSIDWYWHWGANVRHYSYEIDTYRAEAWGGDLGLLYRMPKKIWGHYVIVGSTLHNVFNTNILWSTGHKDSMPMRLNSGIAAYGRLFDNQYILSSEFSFEGMNKTTLHAGVEYWLLNDFFALRAGMDDGALTLGTGLKAYGFSLDYAQADYKDLGLIYRVTLGYSF